LKIKVEEIKEKAVILSTEEPVGEYPELTNLSISGECDFIAPVKVDLTAIKEYDHIKVDGHVETSVRLQCSRCLDVFEMGLASSFTLFYNEDSGSPLDEDEELREEELATIHYQGDYIDFTSEIEEQLIMELPYKPLCKEDCKGLCSTCGANLNDQDCGCRREGAGFKFGALKDYKVNK